MNNKKYIKLIIFCYSLVLLVACGGGGSSSGSSENAKTEAGELTGVYSGTGMIELINENTGKVVDSQAHDASISISQEGVVSISTSNGSSGSAQLRNNNTFQLKADARTQFDGQCESGEIQLNGNVAQSSISATYSSESLFCNGVLHRIEGVMTLSRGGG